MADTTIALQSLLDRMRSGDDLARKELIERANRRLAIIARKLLRSFPRVSSEEETAGVVNEAYPRLDKALVDLKPGDVRQFLALASLKMRQTLLDMVRRLNGRGEIERPDVVPLQAPGADGVIRGAEPATGGDEMFGRARGMDVLDSIEKLGDSQREVIELLYFQGLTQAEAGAVLGVSEDTVKRRWAEARVTLFTRLKAYRPGDTSA